MQTDWTAWVAEETPEISMYNAAFVYEGYGCHGMLMWVPQDDAEARSFMMEALRTLSVPDK
ncbi:MAG: hypothetical protein J5841_06285 [Clostridia bacterium]|nr:hypothetical protein [Clostridia bacterium]